MFDPLRPLKFGNVIRLIPNAALPQRDTDLRMCSD
jgi:hypothetical protein